MHAVSHAVSGFVQAVDAFMAANKVLVLGNSAPQWQQARDNAAKRLKMPLEVNDEQHGQFLLIDSFPNHQSLRFHLAIIFDNPAAPADHGQVVCRLDFHHEAIHSNGFGQSVPELVRGPHWHSWELNRHTIKRIDRHFDLHLAEEFTQARQFDAALRWYCKERNIQLGAHQIELPLPGDLF